MRVERIPDERVGVLIGEDGETVEELKELTNTEIEVDEGEINVEGEDPMEEIRAQRIVKAIGRGFSPEKAFRLLEDNSDIAIIDVTDYEETKNGKERIKGRVIGRDGEAKEHIENETDTEISVYGKTVSILGEVKNVHIAKKAVEKLLEGRSHGTAYQVIDKNRQKLI
ncbi:MAG: KH domain-containing protein [Candidatus Nanohaloarchaeota archaeon QJJ-9]|nr:KH domain-containing protein [Candidatus Nanohaloarchaeota archaeon QJJ-9]